MSNLPTRPKSNTTFAKVNVQKSVAAGRRAGIPEADIRKLLASGRLGRTVPDTEMREIAKGVKFDRWSKLQKAIKDCDKMLARRDLPDDIRVAVMGAKSEYLKDMATLTMELDEIGKRNPSPANGQFSPHSFNPREQIGNVAAVQVTIGTAQGQPPAPVTDVPQIHSLPSKESS